VAMKYQKGTVFPQGKRVKMWYGKYLVYRKDQHGKEVCTRRTVALCPKAEMPKWKAEQKLNEIILKETRACHQMGQMLVAARWMAARKLRAVLS
jgi:hypothetical protein